MKLEDFVKELAINLTADNASMYKQQASALIMDVDTLTGGELASMINIYNSYGMILKNIFDGDTKKMNRAIKKIMTETEYPLFFAFEFYYKDKSAFSWFNKKTKENIAKPSVIPPKDMTPEVMNYWLDNSESQIFIETNMLNEFKFVVNSNDKKVVSEVTNHKNFKYVASQYPLVDILVKKQELLTKDSFNKIFERAIKLINANSRWNTDFSKDLAPIIKIPYFEMKHYLMLTDAQKKGMYEYAVENNIEVVSSEIRISLYEIDGDERFLPDDVKDIFIF